MTWFHGHCQNMPQSRVRRFRLGRIDRACLFEKSIVASYWREGFLLLLFQSTEPLTSYFLSALPTDRPTDRRAQLNRPLFNTRSHLFPTDRYALTRTFGNCGGIRASAFCWCCCFVVVVGFDSNPQQLADGIYLRFQIIYRFFLPFSFSRSFYFLFVFFGKLSLSDRVGRSPACVLSDRAYRLCSFVVFLLQRRCWQQGAGCL